MVRGIASLLSQLNDLRILYTDSGRDKDIIDFETEKKCAIAVESSRIAMIGVSDPESVHKRILILDFPFRFGV